MPSTTPNFGFEYPLSSDPLADGAQSIQDFATTADTTFADLKGGTTDQYLAKNSNTDMDFKWVTFPNTDSFILIGSASLSGASYVSITSIPNTYQHLFFYVDGASSTNGSSSVNFGVRFNADTTSYSAIQTSILNSTTVSQTATNSAAEIATRQSFANSNIFDFSGWVYNYTSTSGHRVHYFYNEDGNQNNFGEVRGSYNGGVINELGMVCRNGGTLDDFDGGTLYVYGVK